MSLPRNTRIDEIPFEGSGRVWISGKHAVGPDPEAALVSTGARKIFCLVEPGELQAYPAYAEWLEAADGDRAMWSPIGDYGVPGIEQTTAIVDAMVSVLEAGEGFIVHCAAGLGRAPTMAICALVARGLDPDEARSLVAEHRPGAGHEAPAQHNLVDSFRNHCSGE